MTPEYEARAAEVTEARVRHEAHPRVMAIVDAVSASTGYSVADILGNSRRVGVIEARDLAAYEARQERHSWAVIGRAMNRHHTSIIDAVRREEARRAAR